MPNEASSASPLSYFGLPSLRSIRTKRGRVLPSLRSDLPFLRSVPPSLRSVLPSLIRASPLFVRFRRREGRRRPREGNDARREGSGSPGGSCPNSVWAVEGGESPPVKKPLVSHPGR